MHICNDLLSIGVRAFSMDPATLTAFSNDHGYENAFSKWILVVGDEGDLLIALSGSGKSPNILNAVENARKIGMDVFTVFGTGLDMQRAEELQIETGHELWRSLKN